MMRLLLSILLVLAMNPVHAQSGSDGESQTQFGPRRQISTIVYVGLAGAVLGLSTLSFYGRPQDNLSNIPLGFGVGILAGTIYMTYQAATNPRDFYRSAQKPNLREHKPVEVSSVFALQHRTEKPQLSYSWTF